MEIPPESKTADPPRIKAIDFFPGTGEFIVGTDESDIWQINPIDQENPTGPKEMVLTHPTPSPSPHPNPKP